MAQPQRFANCRSGAWLSLKVCWPNGRIWKTKGACLGQISKECYREAVLKICEMLRREARRRREYLYRKSIEDRERSLHEKKRKYVEADKEGRSLPTELKKESDKLRKAVEYTDKEREEFHDHQDDEYAYAGVEDPKLVITTSHNPSSRLKQFCKEMCLVFPNCQRLNRGNYVLNELVTACRANDVTDLILLHEHRGEPDGLVISHFPFGPTVSFSLSGTVMRHDLPKQSNVPQAFPHLIFHNLSSPLGQRVKSVLKYLFPVPKEDSRRVCTFANEDDYILFRHHMYKKVDGEIQLKEIGPRLEMRLFEIRRGTIDQTEADTEWRLRPYLNTARKRKYLSKE